MSGRQMEAATFAAGCFWGVEARFRACPGVSDAEVGYTGGHTDDADYRSVCSGTTGHAEAVRLQFDPEVVSYTDLLTLFFDMHNPTTRNRQGPDIGTQYRSAIFWHSEEQRLAAVATISELQTAGRWPLPIVTEVSPAGVFWRAEEYHQRYVEKHGGGHCAI